MLKEGVKLYQKASCHPMIKEHVAPVVDSILMTWPFIGFTWCCGIFYDPIALGCCCFIELPYLLCVEIPINSFVAFIYFILSPVIIMISLIVLGFLQLNYGLAILPIVTILMLGFSCIYCCGPFWIWLFFIKSLNKDQFIKIIFKECLM